MANADAITADQQVARIFEWRRGFNTIHLIDVGVRLGLFKALVEAPGRRPPRRSPRGSACMRRTCRSGARPPTAWSCSTPTQGRAIGSRRIST